MQFTTKQALRQRLAGATVLACLVPLLHGCGSGTTDTSTTSNSTTNTTTATTDNTASSDNATTNTASTDNATTNTASADAKLPDGWAMVAGDGFTVAMPSTPTKKKDTKHDGYDWDIEKDNVDYDASYTNIKGAAKLGAKDMEGVVSGFSKQGTVSGKKAITVQGHPGIEESVATTKGLDMRVKAVAGSNRLYLLIVTAATGKITTPEADQFMNSFKLTEGDAGTDTAPAKDDTAAKNDAPATDNSAKPDATTAP